MRKSLFLILISSLALVSCRQNENEIQQIDQILEIFMDSAGIDLLNAKIPGAYSEIRLNDVNGLTDSAPVAFTTKKTADTLTYLEYIAGARRLPVDSAGELKVFESRIAFALTRRPTDSTFSVKNDTMRIRYRSTPELFQVSEVWYNGELRFTKTAGEKNIVRIQK